MKTESVIVAIPHQGRPTVSHVSDDDWNDSTVELRMDEMQKMFTQEETTEENHEHY